MSEKEFLKQKDMLLNSIEQNIPEHWKNYYKGVPIECIYDDLVLDINEIKRLTEENQELKSKIKTYEEPEDLTLMFMYCDEKAKYKIKELKDRIDKALEMIKNRTYLDCDDLLILENLLKGDKETLDLFKNVKTITKIPPIPKDMDTSNLQEFIDELKGDKE